MKEAISNEKIKILITGASGFIGTNAFKYFFNKGFQVINLDIKEPQDRNYMKYWKKVDITDLSSFKKIVVDFNPHYILHLAARTDLDGSTIDDYSANTVGVENLLNIVYNQPQLKKVLITSSRFVCPNGYYPKDQFDYAPHTIYGESKVLTEKYVWNHKPNCDWAILRPTSIWGPWFSIPYRNFFDMIMAKMYFHIGNKVCYKTYGYVGNSVYQIEQILFNETLNENNKVFYIGDNPAYNINEWADEIAKELGFKVIRMPYFIIKCAAWFGDVLKLFKIHFPMTSFRLHNMTTNNINDMSNTIKLAPNVPFTRLEGVKITLKWIKEV